MWYSKFIFFNKQNGLLENQLNSFYDDLTNEEIKQFSVSMELISVDQLNILKEFKLPSEFLQLLEYSNGGGIINDAREFGYFSPLEVRNYYFSYGFPKWAPQFLPIALNGGGIFYAYDFRDFKNVSIVVVSAGNMDYQSSVKLGETLEEVLSKTTNIEEELYS